MITVSNEEHQQGQTGSQIETGDISQRGMSTEGTTTIEKESEEAYLLRLKQNGYENNKYTKKTSIRFSSHFKWFLVILLCLLSWLVLYEFIRGDNFPRIGIPKRHRRAWKPGLDWFPTDPYTLDAAYYDHFKNRTEVPNKCPASAQSFTRLANVIEIFSVGHNGLYWMGGTGKLRPMMHLRVHKYVFMYACMHACMNVNLHISHP